MLHEPCSGPTVGAPVRFNVLGPLEAHQRDRRVDLGGGRQRALLALLLVHGGQVVSRDRLIDELWNGQPQPGASRSLDAYLSRLRRAFREAGAEDVIETRSPGYVVRADETDAACFEALAREGHEAMVAGEPERASCVLREALALWRGRAYLEVADEAWARPEAERLEELRLTATEDLIDAELALGRHAGCVAELELLVARHPMRERLVGQLMLALYRSGRQADALTAYRDARRALVEQMGLEPGPELQRLQAAVLAHDPALEAPALGGDRAREPRPAGTPSEPAVQAPPRWPRTRTRLAVWAAVFTAAAAIAAVAVEVTGGRGGRALRVSADGAAAIDPRDGHVQVSADVGSAPSAIVSGAGRVWVANGADGSVSRIDPVSGQVDQTIEVGSSPTGIAAGAGAIWVANALDGSISRIDPHAGRVVQTIHVGRRPVAVVVGSSAVWVADADSDALVTLDPSTGIPRRTIRLDASPHGLAVGLGAVWVAEPLAHKLVRVDAHSGDVLAEVPVGAGAGPVAVGAGAVWVLNTLDGTLSRVDPARDAVSSTVAVGDAPSSVAASAAGVWVADQGAARLVGIDPQTGGVRIRYALGAPPVAVALRGATPWLAAGAAVAGRHRGGTLRVMYRAFTYLDPAQPFDVHPGIWRATGDGLVAVTNALGAGELVPDLATAVPQPTDGGLTYAFRLRPGLRYSTDAPVRASDFRRAFERIFTLHADTATYYTALRGAGNCTRRPGRCDLSAGVVTDDSAATVLLHLIRPDPDFLFKLALPPARPVPPGTPRDRLTKGPIPGTGPYREALFQPGRRLLLVRNERFHEWSRAAQPDGYPDRIDIRMADDPNQRVTAVLHHNADIALEVAAADLAPLRLRFAPQLHQHTQPDTSFFAFNVRRPPFDVTPARQAVNLAIDRRTVAQRLGGQALAMPTCQVLPPNFPAHNDYCPWTRPPLNGRWHGTDLRHARALVHASGTPGAQTEVIMRTDDPAASGQALYDALRRLGYQPHVTRLSGPAFARRVSEPTRWNIASGEWTADYPSPGDFLDLFLSCSNYHPDNPEQTTNDGGFCVPAFDRLVSRAQRLQLTDPAAAERVWAAADRLAVDDAAWIPLVSTSSIEFFSTRTGHFTVDANSQPQIDQLWVR
jgi:YVTN family beta-propeller protein